MESLAAGLRRLVSNPQAVLTSDEDLIAYGYDAAWFERRPLVVVMPENAQEVCAIHRFAFESRIPITPRAMGSGLSGGAVPSERAIALNVARMNRIVEIDRANRTATVEPGVITGDLHTAVERVGLFYPPDPSSLRQSAIGGNIAENAGGARCLKYGVTADYVTALEVVLPDGTLIRTGGKTVKNVTGYDLRALFTGAEGTLGTITQATLRLLPKPKYTRTALAAFPSLERAAECVTAVMSSGILPTAVELLDRLTMSCVNELRPGVFSETAAASLIFAADGSHEDSVSADLSAIAEIARAYGATEVEIAQDDAAADRIWQARRAVSPALARRRPNKLSEDICVPCSAIANMIERIGEIAAKYALEIPVFGHAGDGNLHPNILCDRRDADEVARVMEAGREIFESAIALGGTLSGEHGIGILKKEFMEMDLGADALALMRRIKNAVDPHNIMNPGKVFPE